MIKYKIIITQTFRNDFQKLFNYISFINPKSRSLKFIYNQIMSAIYTLEFLPERYAKILKPNKLINIRKLIFDKYVIIYEVNNTTNEVFILHIFHGKQNYFDQL